MKFTGLNLIRRNGRIVYLRIGAQLQHQLAGMQAERCHFPVAHRGHDAGQWRKSDTVSPVRERHLRHERAVGVVLRDLLGSSARVMERSTGDVSGMRRRRRLLIAGCGAGRVGRMRRILLNLLRLSVCSTWRERGARGLGGTTDRRGCRLCQRIGALLWKVLCVWNVGRCVRLSLRIGVSGWCRTWRQGLGLVLVKRRLVRR
mmetsp:Transcript_22951/g.57527  ORF Transcript_22951/g.57527 Transcript_22951/m.57527 type:complete len:202 (+) Transcript_22951:1314-1919(+)